MQSPQTKGVTPLNARTLDALPSGTVCPSYGRSGVTPGIVHIGVGNFHRAHQAWYLQQLMQTGEALDWGIVGAGVREFDERQRQVLAGQDFLTTLIELDPADTRVEVVGSMIDYVPVSPMNAPLVARLAQTDIRIVSLTITEGGYFIDPATNTFNANDPDILHDAANIETPKTVFGIIVAALKSRQSSGAGPLTALSCDNLQGNGQALRNGVLGLADMVDSKLARWIDQNCTFPNTMVDCIVPATTDKERALVKTLGIDDAVPVTHENFREWVIEDQFCAGRPPWEKAGAILTQDVKRHEQMKIRILNGGHQVIAGCGEMLSIETIAGAMDHPDIRAFLTKIVAEEIAPHVDPVPGTPVSAYFEQVAARFSNAKIVDTTRRVSSNGTTYHPAFVFPSIIDGLTSGAPVSGLALVEAIWARMAEGTREDGSVIAPKDAQWEALKTCATKAKSEPSAWLEMRHIYGDLADASRFSDAFARWLPLVWSEGVEAAIRTYLSDGTR